MQSTVIGLTVFMIVIVLVARPLGLWILPLAQGRAPRCLVSADRKILRLFALHDTPMNWCHYALSCIAFNVLGVLILYTLQRAQGFLPLNPAHFGSIPATQAFNTAISFVTNTNWQNYVGESTMSYFTQMMGLGVQNFVSAATGIAVAFALMRAFVRHESEDIGNFWVDIVRINLWVLLPICIVYALFLVSQGVIQTLAPYVTVTTLAGQHQTIALGPVASQEAIKLLGTNGGGFFNANSAHPFENPTQLSNFIESLSIFLIPASLTYTFGRMVKDTRQGWTIFGVMSVIFIVGVLLLAASEFQSTPALLHASADPTMMNMEGKEVRFDLGATSLFSVATTAASCGAVNAMLDSFSPMAGMVSMLLIQLGEVVFGGAGSGFYGIMIFVIIAVFLAGLMVGRTPEYLGKKIMPIQMKIACIAMLITPVLVLTGAAVSCLTPEALSSLNNGGAHGLSEILYAWSSAANNNGSAFAGLNANTDFYNIGLGIVMWLGRFVMIVAILALSGSMIRQKQLSSSKGTLPTYGFLFGGFLVGVVLLFGALTFLPSLALGPIAEHLMVWFG